MKNKHSIINFLIVVSVLITVNGVGATPLTWQYWFIFVAMVAININAYIEGADAMDRIIKKVLDITIEHIEKEENEKK